MKPWISDFELKQKSSECQKMESGLVIFLENFGFHMAAFQKFLQGMGQRLSQIAYVLDSRLESPVFGDLFEFYSLDTKRQDLSILELLEDRNQKLLPQKVLKII